MSYDQVFDLVGGDRKQHTESVLRDIEKRIDELWDMIFEPTQDDLEFADTAGAGVPDPGEWGLALSGILKRKNFSFGTTQTPAPQDAKEQIKFLHTIREILAKAQGSYLGEDLKADIGDSAEVARHRIKQDPKEAFGPSNRQLAYKVSAALKMLLRDFGDEATYKLPAMNMGNDQITAALANLEKAFASMNNRPALRTHRRVNML